MEAAMERRRRYSVSLFQLLFVNCERFGAWCSRRSSEMPDARMLTRLQFPSYTRAFDYTDPGVRRNSFFRELGWLITTHPTMGQRWQAFEAETAQQRQRREGALERGREEQEQEKGAGEEADSAGEVEGQNSPLDEEQPEVPEEDEVPDLDIDQHSIASTELLEPWELDESFPEPEEEDFEPATGPGSPIVLDPAAEEFQQLGMFFAERQPEEEG
ncbi:uncharacterized protein EI97DRAFT_438196 [Westerdykella ornata]|uniref:Uncharacterized protein n=1 Tax=Westerdykella ornata TaxID=318751 RepID=A0A6A6JYC2_WESOR|nr:uncharacterized protein EI97DRAFT_438196 [Westerdykella ornata]KAF2280746.1 hypothetical protein EI97DRAFT_438196 [Westerdykella ornata]